MRDADRLTALAGGTPQAIVALMAVELQDPVEAVQEILGVLPGSIGCIEEDDPRRIGTIPAAIITRQRPEVAGLGPATSGIQNRCGGLVHEQLGGGLEVLGQSVKHGPQVEGRDTDPVGQRAAMDVNAGTPEDLALPI